MAYLSLPAGTSSAKLNKSSITAGQENLHVDRTEWNELINGLRGQQVGGKHWVALGDNAADPLTLSGLGASQQHMWATDVAGGDVVKRRRGDVATVYTFHDDRGLQVFEVPTRATAPTVAPAGKARFYYDSVLGKWRHSINAVGFADMISGGGGGGTVTSVTAGNATMTVGGTATDPTVAINLSNANTWAAAQTFPNGTAGTGGAILGEANLYRPAANRLGIAFGGALKHDLASTYFALQSGVTMYFGDTGTSTVPGATWIGDQNTGFSNDVADTVSTITGGVARHIVNTTAISKTLPMRGESGSAGTPTWSYTANTDVGRFYATSLVPIVAESEDGTSVGEGISVDSTVQAYFHRDAVDFFTKVGVRRTTANTTNPNTMGGWQAQTSATAGTGFGTRHRIELENAAGAVVTAGYLDSVWEDATSSSEDMAWSFQAIAAGSLAERARLTSLGAWRTGAGSTSLPGWSFLGDTNSGVVNSAGDEMSWVTNATVRAIINNSRMQVLYGGSGPGGFPFEVSTNLVESRISVDTSNASGYAGFNLGANNRATKQLNALIYGSSVAGTAITGVNNADLGTFYTTGVTQMLLYTAGAADLIYGANGAEFGRLVSGGDHLLTQKLKFVTGNQQTTVGAAGGASALPATPLGYWKATRTDGTAVVIPYYNA